MGQMAKTVDDVKKKKEKIVIGAIDKGALESKMLGEFLKSNFNSN
jgi:hypothetical protein